MRIDERLTDGGPSFSFEFFPPKTEDGERNLATALDELSGMDPTFVSVTYGAGGTLGQRAKTIDIVAGIKADFGLEAMAHFTCVNATTAELRSTLDRMRDAGIVNVLALRGDPPQGETEWTATDGGLRYSRELIELIRDDYPEFAIGAACFPEVHIHAESPESDLRYLKEKVDAGARFLITQLFFDNAYYYDFVARAREIGVDVPIVPGIMPITNYGQIRRITEMCGSVIPAHLVAELDVRADDARAVTRLRRRLRHAAVRRPAGQGRARHPLLHAQPLPRDARDPERAARDGALARGGPRLGHGQALRAHRGPPARLDRAPGDVLRRQRAAGRRRARQRLAQGPDRLAGGARRPHRRLPRRGRQRRGDDRPHPRERPRRRDAVRVRRARRGSCACTAPARSCPRPTSASRRCSSGAGFEPFEVPESHRSIVVVHVTRVADSCGYGVPLMDYVGERPHQAASSAKRVRVHGPDAYVDYQREHNAASIDGLPAVEV